MTPTQLREKFQAKQDALGKVFTEAKTADGQYDFHQVKCLEDIKDGPGKSIAVAERAKAMNAELDEIGKEIEALDAAEKARLAHEAREKSVRRPPFPGGPGGKGGADQIVSVKSVGQRIAEEKRFEEWVKRGAPQGIDFQLDDMLPSDMLAKAWSFDRIGAKALFETGAGWSPESVRLPGFVEAVTRPLQLVDIMPVSQTGQDTIKYMEETTRTHAAAETAEGGTFAESEFALTERTSPVQKITDSVPVTDEQLEDEAQVQSYLNGRLNFGIRQRLDGQLLVGNGTSPNLRGLKNTVGILTQAKGVDPVPDAFFRAMRKIRVTGRAMPTHHIIHPEDWENIRLLRTSDGVYIWGNPSEAGPERMWGLPVVQNEADAAGTGYVGSFLPPWVTAYERRGIVIQIGYVGSQFVQGKRTIRGDTRWAVVFFRPAAFSSVTGL